MDPTTQRLLAGSSGARKEEVIIVCGNSGFLSAFKWTDTDGWGDQYSDPSVTIAGSIFSIACSVSRTALILGSNVSPYIYAYEWDDATGFGAKYSDPSALNNTVATVARHPTEDQFCGTSISADDYVYEIEWDDATGFGTITAGLGPDTNNYNSVSFSPDGTQIAVTRTVAPYVQIFNYSTSTKIGAAIDSFSTPDFAYDVKWNENGDLISIAHRDSPNVAVTTWDGSNIGTLRSPTGTGSNTVAAFAAMLTPGACVWGYPVSPFIYGAPINQSTGEFGTLFSNPSTLPPNDVNNLAFNSTYTTVFATCVSLNTDSLLAYEWDDSTGFGTKYADPVATTYPGNLQAVYALYGKNGRNGFA